MINLKEFTGFCAIQSDHSPEYHKLYVYCTQKNIPIIKVQDNQVCPINYVPIGSVEWCEKSLDKKIIPDYYPLWLRNYLYRNVWVEDQWPLGRKVFIKPWDRHKKFHSFITFGTYAKKKKPPFWCSDIVKFTNEWRYYISAGKVLCGEWYWGDEINEPEAPKLSKYNITIPRSFYGTLDFGTLDTGEFALVEAHPPYACGWYGKDIKLYAQWLIDGWIYMQGV